MKRSWESILRTPVREFAARNPALLDGSATMGDALELMRKRSEGCVLVTARGLLWGIVTECDMLRCLAEGTENLTHPVEAWMSPDPECLRLDDNLAGALNRMSLVECRHVPIIDDAGGAVAVLSLRDIIAYLVSLSPAAIYNLPPDLHRYPEVPEGA